MGAELSDAEAASRPASTDNLDCHLKASILPSPDSTKSSGPSAERVSHEGMVEDKYIGLALAVSSSVAIGTSFIITKKVPSFDQSLPQVLRLTLARD